MYTIITLYVIGYAFFVYVNYKEWEAWDSFVILMPLIESLLFALVGAVIAIILPIKYKTTSWSENIVTLKDNNSVKGSFFLGSGMIEGQMKYVYYQQNEDSTYQMWQANYYDAKIKYTNKQPKIVITDVRPEDNTWNKWAFDLIDESNQKYIFEVPQGSIRNGYELDAQ